MKFQDDISNEWTDKPKPIYSSNFFIVFKTTSQRMDGQAETNILFQLFQSWEQKVGSIIRKYLLLCKMVTIGTLQQSFRPGNKASQEHIVW